MARAMEIAGVTPSDFPDFVPETTEAPAPAENADDQQVVEAAEAAEEGDDQQVVAEAAAAETEAMRLVRLAIEAAQTYGAGLKSPAEKAAERTAAQAERTAAQEARQARQAKITASTAAIKSIAEEVLATYLHALQDPVAPGAKEIIAVFSAWPLEAKRLILDGDKEFSAEELRLGLRGWLRAENARKQAALDAAKARVRAYSEGAVSLLAAMRSGGDAVVNIAYRAMRKERFPNGTYRMVPLGNKERHGLIKIRVLPEADRFIVLDSFEHNCPPHIPTAVPLPLRPPAFKAEGVHKDLASALQVRYTNDLAAEKDAAENAEYLGEAQASQAYASYLGNQGTLKVGDLFAAVRGSGTIPSGMVAVNNPSLWVTPGDPKSQRFHLAFTARVEESGAFTLQQWWSSSGAVSLAILVGRELVMEVDANGRVGLRDPNLPENNEEVKAAIKAAISRIIGAMVAQMVWDRRKEQATKPAPATVATEPVATV
ncbi:MAG: hypothetical protein A3B96_01955 [Candidatus Spechtbacteria bacterium RIFCSPHIGHO2_02_FULL_43_15b]|nr:MAG: hypothetical protein A3B96_01955 [Candidatus Spechtbacteria bacterium RIFCSPHIGHO2_02_FULL_43_15b]